MSSPSRRFSVVGAAWRGSRCSSSSSRALFHSVGAGAGHAALEVSTDLAVKPADRDAACGSRAAGSGRLRSSCSVPILTSLRGTTILAPTCFNAAEPGTVPSQRSGAGAPTRKRRRRPTRRTRQLPACPDFGRRRVFHRCARYDPPGPVRLDRIGRRGMGDVQRRTCAVDTTARSRSAPARGLTGSGRASATTRVDDSEEGGGPPAQRGAQAPHVRRQSPEPDDGERVQDDISTGDQASHGAVSVSLRVHPARRRSDR